MKKKVKALVTGADGFIGSHLTEYLLKQGYYVRALSQYNSFGDLGWLEEVTANEYLEVLSGDIRDPNYCSEITKNVDVVFHLAALIAIPYSYISPKSYIDTNIYGTINICKAALDNNVSKVIHTSTSEVYGTAQYVPIDEGHPLQPQSPYSASKIGADAMAMSFFRSFDLPLIVARPFNTYGPRQSARAVIPSVISQIASGKTKIELGDLSPTRDFNYVLDTVEAMACLALTKNLDGEVINIGSNYEISIRETVELIAKIMNRKINIIKDKTRFRPQKSEVFRLYCDNKKLISKTGFHPKVNLETGLNKTISWFTKPSNLKRYKPNIYNV